MHDPKPRRTVSALGRFLALPFGGAFFLLRLAGAPAVTIPPVHRPYLQNVRPDTATVVWSTREAAPDFRVEYSVDLSFSRSAVPYNVRSYPPAVTRSSYTFVQY